MKNIFILFNIFISLSIAQAQGPTIDYINKVKAQAKTDAEKINIPKAEQIKGNNALTPEKIYRMKEQAQIDSESMVRPKISEQTKKNAQKTYDQIRKTAPYPLQFGDVQTVVKKPSDETPHLLLFVSSSMPLNTLKQYANQIHNDQLNVTMVIRGFVDGINKIGPTVAWVNTIIDISGDDDQKLNVPFEIDPLKFRTFNIQTVPTFVMEKNNQVKKISGDVSISYVLEKFI